MKKCVKYKKELPSTIIINTNDSTLRKYFEWKNNDSDMCIECWNNEKNYK